MALHKDMSDKIIGQFTTSNKTSRGIYFNQYWMKISAWNLEMETLFIYEFSNEELIVPK